MTPVQASQLSQKHRKKQGFLSDKLPPGSLQRKTVQFLEITKGTAKVRFHGKVRTLTAAPEGGS